MNQALRLIPLLPAFLFLSFGVRWLLAPAGIAAELGMPLLDGIGRSTQIGDFGSFFVACGVMIILGVITLQRQWFYASAMLVGIAATFRINAWLFHGAALAGQIISFEVGVAIVLLLAATRLCGLPQQSRDDRKSSKEG